MDQKPPALFPPSTRSNIISFQTSSWYETFSAVTIKSVIIRPLSDEFREFLQSDGVTIPDGSEDVVPESTLSDSGSVSGDSASGSEEPKSYAFPELDAQIRAAIAKFGAVFPKLNWTSPKDAAWIANPSSPLKCTTPADVYLYLKSSDFVGHDIDPAMVFDGCIDNPVNTSPEDAIPPPGYDLELVLKKWYAIDHSRELRCFVRDGKLVGICQRDGNFYEHLNEAETQKAILETVNSFWESKIKGKFPGGDNYVFDILLSKALTSAHVLDFNPYAPRTDSILFTYEELRDLVQQPDCVPVLKVIDSRHHPLAARNAPAHQHNMMPREALELSQGQSMQDFQDLWLDQVRRAATEQE
ncbi:hypothetical protein FRB99_006419 [Tulasnella sp. 403]|nr:hypothetical protein FRB99_006419 [Tulasnella sp. 403]